MSTTNDYNLVNKKRKLKCWSRRDFTKSVIWWLCMTLAWYHTTTRKQPCATKRLLKPFIKKKKEKRKKKVYSFSERLDCPCHWQSLYSNKFLCTPAKHYVYMLFSGSFPAKLDKLFWWYWLITAIILVLCLLEEHEILWRGKITDFRNKNSKIYNWVTEVYTNTTYIHF